MQIVEHQKHRALLCRLRDPFAHRIKERETFRLGSGLKGRWKVQNDIGELGHKAHDLSSALA